MTSRKDHAETTETNAAAAASKLHDHAACGAGECHHLERELHDAGTRFMDSTKGLREELARQAQRHPLATFGAAFAAGLLLARALRR